MDVSCLAALWLAWASDLSSMEAAVALLRATVAMSKHLL